MKTKKRLKVPGGTLHPDRKNRYKAAYELFKLLYKLYNTTNDEDAKVYCIRNVECSIEEAGINGKYVGLISEKAFQSKIKAYEGKKLTKKQSVSTEHPITYRNIAKHLLNQKEIPNAEQYFKFWLNKLIKVKTTFEENIGLREYQANFNIMKDDWKKMYEKAGIKLVDDVNFKSNKVKEELGLI